MSMYEKSVFINCPFDDDYDEIFDAILFTVHRCGFILRCSKEFEDSSSIRIKNIVGLIKESKYSIHDLSRVSLSKTNKLPRFNMPLELGIFIGAIEFGDAQQAEKDYLIMESKKFRFKEFISDLSGQDIRSHNDMIGDAIRIVRNYLIKKVSNPADIPSASIVLEEYNEFLLELPKLCKVNRWVISELEFSEYSSLVTTWLALR